MLTIAGLGASRFDAASDTIVIECEGADGRRDALGVRGGAIGPLVLHLLNAGRDRAARLGRSSEELPLPLLDATALSLADGTAGIHLQVQSNIRFALSLDRPALGALRTALAECDKLLASSSARH